MVSGCKRGSSGCTPFGKLIATMYDDTDQSFLIPLINEFESYHPNSIPGASVEVEDSLGIDFDTVESTTAESNRGG